jgi:hypothetical protein
MKKLINIGLSVIFIIVCIFLLWQHAKVSRDRVFRQKLVGTWSLEIDNTQFTNIYAPDGSFTSQEIFNHAKNTNTYQMAGIWHIQDGNLIQTITNDSRKRAHVPRTGNELQIIRVDGYELVEAAGQPAGAPVEACDTNKLVLKRVIP